MHLKLRWSHMTNTTRIVVILLLYAELIYGLRYLDLHTKKHSGECSELGR